MAVLDVLSLFFAVRVRLQRFSCQQQGIIGAKGGKRGRFPGGLGARHSDEGRQAGFGRRTRHGEAVADELVE